MCKLKQGLNNVFILVFCSVSSKGALLYIDNEAISLHYFGRHLFLVVWWGTGCADQPEAIFLSRIFVYIKSISSSKWITSFHFMVGFNPNHGCTGSILNLKKLV
jgi:hypothetical protein